MAKSRFSTSARTGGSTDGVFHEPRVDRDPFYRTLAIFNSIFKKKFKLVPDSHNATDCKENIYVNFGETKYSSIIGFSRASDKDGKSFYALACGHEWEGNAGHPLDGSKSGACWKCGSHQAYLGFEHEWQHIIFKSDLQAQHLFCEGYTDQLVQMAPNIDRKEISGFLKMLVNSFDDIRCNSLWEKIYPGSAEQIWKRWTRLTRGLKEENFLNFIFRVAFDVPTDPNGPFEQLRPVVAWAVSKVKYRGFANMLLQVRVVVEHCMATVLSTMRPALPPPPPPPLSQPQKSQDDDNGQGSDGQLPSSSEGNDDVEPGDHAAGGPDGGMVPGQAPVPGGQGSGEEHGSTAPVQDPSSSQVPHPQMGPGREAASGALKSLIAGAKPLDKGESHLDPDFVDITAAMKSNSLKAMVAQVLSLDVTDIQDIDQKMPTNVPDKDMQATIDFISKAIEQQQSLNSQLTGGAKARVTIIDVPPDGIPESSFIVLEPETKMHIARMRAAFFKAMGRQKARRASEGTEIDVQAFIQYKLDRQDPDVFIAEEVQQGFSYSIVCDMSGSMSGTFPQVAQAAEMLREALDFPFVRGDVWGFRGGDGHGEKKAGEVWIYRYSPHVKGYIGKGFEQNERGRWEYPVRCGGITPMNTAINVTARHQHRCVSEGMAKRMFLLTDGSPLQTRITGGQISGDTLQKFVANEIRKARNRGIQVYTLVIGEHAIPEEECVKMFGPRKFWRRVANKDVGRELSNLVIENFQKYLSNKS